ncbi:uncharacterized protein BDW43DRAFT_308823 [Aspergillus alliaceus]|uniref:uncharacterized protein n=1 Tax=Petromyces alliaceus TaxID=209559 RepID=UPI0012A4C9EF|nr:uncharacterized protein BDW43DRAFT_308823 [Aspergillus alliaceus]KAB8236019.1 hypothetical protein BDW43DRAFT_308823 [Aspergillus alliaceus]
MAGKRTGVQKRQPKTPQSGPKDWHPSIDSKLSGPSATSGAAPRPGENGRTVLSSKSKVHDRPVQECHPKFQTPRWRATTAMPMSYSDPRSHPL